MNSIVDFPLFLVTGIILNITPGQDTFYVISRTLGQGGRAGILSALGISTGALVHTSLTAFGLSTIISRYPEALLVVKYGGGAWLIYLGMASFYSLRGEVKGPETATPVSKGALYIQGFITNLLNPKILIFFLSFLPRFVAPGFKTTPLPYLILGGAFICTGTLWCFILALATARTGKFIFERTGSTKLLTAISAVMLTVLGVLVLVNL